jgi:hypothetical protein
MPELHTRPLGFVEELQLASWQERGSWPLVPCPHCGGQSRTIPPRVLEVRWDTERARDRWIVIVCADCALREVCNLDALPTE